MILGKETKQLENGDKAGHNELDCVSLVHTTDDVIVIRKDATA